MPRIRTIKPDFFTSEDIGALTVNSRLLYVALWCQADREGKMKFQRTRLMTQTMPFEQDNFDNCLNELISAGHVIWYTAEEVNYLFLPKFLNHQRPHKTEAKSIIPDFDQVEQPLTNGDTPVKQPSNNAQEREREREKEREKNKSIDNSRPKKGQEIVLTLEQFDRFRKKFPGTKRGLQVEFDNFKKRHNKSWKTILPLLLPNLERQIEQRQLLANALRFVPEWPHLKTYINNAGWETEYNTDPDQRESIEEQIRRQMRVSHANS
jgi:hypothetical protein